MKNYLSLIASLAAIGITSVSAQDLTYDYANNPGWFAAGAWTNTVPTTTNWTTGANAVIGVTGNKSITFDQNTTIGNLTTSGSTAHSATLTDTVGRTLTFSGGTIDTSSGNFFTAGGVSIQGNYTKEGIGVVRVNGSSASARYDGTATVNAGRIEVVTHLDVGTDSNFTVNTGGAVQLRNGAATAFDLGAITLDGGNFELSRNNTNQTLTANVSSLGGSSGNLSVVVRTSLSAAGTTNATLNVNQSGTTTFGANIIGYNVANSGDNEAFLTLNKQGDGSLTLSGDIDLRRQTTVSGGTLLINSSDATFTNGLSTTAIAVNAALGGTGTLGITGGDNVVLGATGSLIAGLAGSAGRTTFNLSGGSLDLTLATAGSATGWLKFDLGAATTTGTTYDNILLTGTGSLNIGTGLNFSDFDFTALSGFGGGTYTLFTTTALIMGSLGTTTGQIAGLDGTLAFSGNDLVLTVVPEPAMVALLFCGLVFVIVANRVRMRLGTTR